MKIALTFDVECDCPPYLSSTKGIEKGLPAILSILNKFDIKSTFFVAGNIGEIYPNIIREVSKHHEIGSHSYLHEPLNELTPELKMKVRYSKELLEKITGSEVLGFRAPYLKVCDELFTTLKEIGFKYDSSIGTFMRSHRDLNVPIQEFRLEIPNVILRFPRGLSKFKKVCKKSHFPVLFFHPWEAIDMRKLLPKSIKNYYMRPDNWYRTGDPFIKKLEFLIKYLKTQQFQFVVLRDMI